RILVSLAISSNVRISSRRSHSSPSAGMQYVHRKLHLSVTEIRTEPIRRPQPSTSGSTLLAYPCSAAFILRKPHRRSEWRYTWQTAGGRQEMGTTTAAPGLRRRAPAATTSDPDRRVRTCEGAYGRPRLVRRESARDGSPRASRRHRNLGRHLRPSQG